MRKLLLFIACLGLFLFMPITVQANEIENEEIKNENKWIDIQYEGIEIHNNCKVIDKKIVSQYKDGGSYYITNYEY